MRSSADMLTFRYVPHHLATDYARLGWLPVSDLGLIHGEWCHLFEWLCACPVMEPVAVRTEMR